MTGFLRKILSNESEKQALLEKQERFLKYDYASFMNIIWQGFSDHFKAQNMAAGWHLRIRENNYGKYAFLELSVFDPSPERRVSSTLSLHFNDLIYQMNVKGLDKAARHYASTAIRSLEKQMDYARQVQAAAPKAQLP